MLVVLASAMFFATCNGPKEDELAVTSPNLVSGKLEFLADDGVPQTVAVETNVNSWEVTKSADWIKTGRSNKDFTVSVEKYTDTSNDRTGTITVTAGNAKSVIVSVTQKKAKKNTLSVDKATLSYSVNETGSKAATVTTDADSWDATSPSTWFIIQKQDKTLSITVNALNRSADSRSAEITVTAGNADPVKVTVSQQGTPNSLKVEPESVLFAENKTNTESLTVTTDADSWNFTSASSWLTSEKQGNTLKITPNSLNSTQSVRTATINFTAGTATPVNVTVTQAVTKNTLTVTPLNHTYLEGETGIKTATVTTDAPSWEYKCLADWLMVGKNGNILQITPTGPNSGSAARTAEITVTAGNADPKAVTIRQEVTPPVYLRVNPSPLSYEAGQTGNKTLTVETNATSWDATASSSWFTIQKQTNSIIVTASSLNNGTSQRTANITVTAPGATMVYVAVTQDPTPYLTVDPTTTITFAYNETSPSKTATVSTNVASWTFNNNSTSWLNVEKNNNTLNINPISENTGTAPRTATITITAGTLTANVTVTQAGNIPILEVDTPNITFGFGETSMKYTTVTTTAASWSHSGSANWLTIAPQGNQLRFTPTGLNTTASDRSVTITVSAPGANSVTVTVTQVRTILTVSPTTPITFAANETSPAKTATVTTTAASWSYDNNSTSWLNVVKNNNTLSINPTSANTGTSDRTATITISATGAPSVIVTVTQARPTLSVSPTTLTFAATSPGTQTVTVTTTAQNWNATSSATWCKISNSGNTISVSPDANTGAARTATITVTAPGANNVTVTVNQNAGTVPTTLTVSPTSHTFVLGESATKTSTVTTNAASWSYTGSASWLTIAIQSNQLRFTPTSYNTGTSQRSANITVTAPGATSVTVTVRQDPSPAPGTYKATGTPFPSTPSAPSSWNGNVNCTFAYSYCSISNWAGTIYTMFLDFVNGKLILDDYTRYLVDIGNYYVYFGAIYQSGTSVYGVTNYPVNYNASTRTLDFTGTYNGNQVYVGLVGVHKTTGANVYFADLQVRGSKLVITPSAASMPDGEMQAVENMNLTPSESRMIEEKSKSVRNTVNEVKVYKIESFHDYQNQ